jgi:allantoinase
VFDPNEVFTVDPARLHHRHKLTPYAGRTLPGVVEAAYVRGALAYTRRDGPADTPRGRLLLSRRG